MDDTEVFRGIADALGLASGLRNATAALADATVRTMQRRPRKNPQ